MGIDVSLTGTGIADWDGEVWKTTLISTKGKKNDTLEMRSDRLWRICSDVGDAIFGIPYFAYGCDLVVIESPSYGSKFGSPHDRSGLWWSIVQMVQTTWGIPVATVSPQGRAKYATGKGNADKDVVLASAIRTYPEAEIVNNNVADAVILAAMGARHLGSPIEASLTELQLAAMDGAAWPA